MAPATPRRLPNLRRRSTSPTAISARPTVRMRTPRRPRPRTAPTRSRRRRRDGAHGAAATARRSRPLPRPRTVRRMPILRRLRRKRRSLKSLPFPKRSAATTPTGATSRCRNGATRSAPATESPLNWRGSRAHARVFHAMATKTDSYAIIAVGGKQYVVREGERLLVDRVGADEGKTFAPGVLFVGGDGAGTLAPRTQVTARVVGHVLGEKVRIGKYRPKNGYKRHNGFRARLTQIEIESIGGDGAGTLAPRTQVTARVVGHVLGEKVRIGKYRPKNGYKRHNGFRARLTQIEIESIGGDTKRSSATAAPKTEPKAEPKQAPVAPPAPVEETAPQEHAAEPPKDYADYTVADIGEKAKHWRLEQVEAALEYERAHANRKGAVAALEATIATKREKQ
ncbi:MAG: 50S ribosomal protein L21 [Actinobacteria bacterium]|nr:MAG: 50S ribosomal protein L21 [Actinomycetota bacterium]